MSLEYFHSQRNGQLVLENQSVATTDTKDREHPKSDLLSQVCDCTPCGVHPLVDQWL